MRILIHFVILLLVIEYSLAHAANEITSARSTAGLETNRSNLFGFRVILTPVRESNGELHADPVCRAFMNLTAIRIIEAGLNVYILNTQERIALLGDSLWPSTNSNEISQSLQRAADSGVDLVVSATLVKQGDQISATLRFDRTSGGGVAELKNKVGNDWIALSDWALETFAQMVGEDLDQKEHQRYRANLGLSNVDVEEFLRLLHRKGEAAKNGGNLPWKDPALNELLKRNPRSLFLRRLKLDERRPESESDDPEKALIRDFPESCTAMVIRLLADPAPPSSEITLALRRHPGCLHIIRAMTFRAMKDLSVDGTEWREMQQILEQHFKETGAGGSLLRLVCAGLRTETNDVEGAEQLLVNVRLPAQCNDPLLLDVLGRASIFTTRRELFCLQLARAVRSSVLVPISPLVLPNLNLTPEGIRSQESSPPRWLDPKELEAGLAAVSVDLLQEPYRNLLVPTAQDFVVAKRVGQVVTNKLWKCFALLGEVILDSPRMMNGFDSNQGIGNCHAKSVDFIRVARAAGYRAWLVHVDKTFDGGQGFHDCALVEVDGITLCFDPALRTALINHAEVEVMDDLQAISHHMFQSTVHMGKPAKIRAALKLNPTSRWARCRFISTMAESGELEEAASELRKLRGDPKLADHWDVNLAAAALASSQRKFDEAAASLERALASNPQWAFLHLKLAGMYEELRNFSKAKEHLAAAEKFSRGDVQTAEISIARSSLKFRSMRGGSDASGKSPQQSLLELAKNGDTAAMLALSERLINGTASEKSEGIEWLTRAAEKGDLLAQLNLVKWFQLLQSDGDGKAARYWAERAANQDSGQAMLVAAEILYSSTYGPPDPVSALKWALLAQRRNLTKANSLIREMQLFMTEAQVTEATTFANKFTPKLPTTKEEKP